LAILRHKIFFVASAESAVNAFLLNHLTALAKKFDVTVVVNTNDLFFLNKQGLDINVISLNISRKIRIFSDLYCLIHLIYIFIKFRPYVVHSITPKAGFLSMLAASISFIPNRIHTFTGQVWLTQHGFKRFFLKSFDWFIANLASFNIVDSLSQQKFLINENVLTEKKSVVFGLGSVSGVDLRRFKPSKQTFAEVRKSLLIPHDAFVFIYLGRLNKDKGILDLANAFSAIENKNTYLLYVGADEGGFIDEIKRINVLKLDSIKFLGFTREPERYLAASNVLCLPSYREGFGSVIIEAAAMQVPTIASNIYGISDAVLNNKTGILHEPGNYKKIAEIMSFFIENPKEVKDFGKAARARAIEEFDANLITAYWLDFYKHHLN
jgi:glycosyltransferase involved in cell wall biosynthesis